MTAQAELLACPFCGGDARVCSYRSCDCCGKAYNAGVTCKCGATIDHMDTDTEAIAAWNTRPQPADGGDGALRDARTIYDIACIREQQPNATREDLDFKELALRNYNRIAAIAAQAGEGV